MPDLVLLNLVRMWDSLIFLVFQYSVLLSSFSFEWYSQESWHWTNTWQWAVCSQSSSFPLPATSFQIFSFFSYVWHFPLGDRWWFYFSAWLLLPLARDAPVPRYTQQLFRWFHHIFCPWLASKRRILSILCFACCFSKAGYAMNNLCMWNWGKHNRNGKYFFLSAMRSVDRAACREILLLLKLDLSTACFLTLSFWDFIFKESSK